MAISVLSCSYLGVETYIVEVEVDISNGLPVFNIVGMGDLAITESRERIRSCFKNIGRGRRGRWFRLRVPESCASVGAG